MSGGGQDERRHEAKTEAVERRGALWSLPDGRRLPNPLEDRTLIVGDPQHPARLREDDLEHPEGFHHRLTNWLLQQG
jgi:hypothetical protein